MSLAAKLNKIASRILEADRGDEDAIRQAKIMGREAFHAGIKQVPAHDANVIKLAADKNLKLAAKIFKAWSKGWVEENFKRINSL